MNKTVILVLRILLGLAMLVFGLNKFLGFMPMPEIAGDGGELMRIWGGSGFMTIIGIMEIVFGAALLAGKFVPLALTFIVAILFNAVLFHGMHAMDGIAGGLVFLIISLVLVYAYKDRFKSLLSA